ncbi:PAS domain S-box protein [Haloarchaeobius sp. HRN-SO-5]|uniref:PAS domain S-box protein n=1 Tax=Haloarchaeobius sp. HRN-SO-5 TaxID=3446118 RepID=UPI003EBCC8D9
MTGRTTRILLVAPDGDERAETMAALPWTVSTATDVESALDALDGTVDCVVTEYDLPDGDGVALLEPVKERRPTCPVFLYTATGDERVAGAAIAAGADGYVPASDGVDVLRERIEAVVEPSGATDATSPRPVESERERLQLVYEQAPLAIVETDLDGTISTWNDGATVLFGYDRSTAVGSDILDLLAPPDERDAIEDIAEDVLSGALESPSVTVNRNVTADGDLVTCEWYNTTLRDHDGEIVGALAFVQDVSEREQMESELVEQKRKIETLHAIASDLDDCETRGDIWERTVEAAERVLDFDSCSVDEVEDGYLVSRALSSSVEPGGYRDRTPVTDGLAGKTYRTGQSWVVDDVQAEDDATPVRRTYRSLLSVPVGDVGVFQAASDEVGAFDQSDLELTELLLTHVADALDRVDFESKLRDERDRFAALFQNVPDPVVYAVHHDGIPRVVEVNPAFEQVFGYDADEITGADLDGYIVPDDRTDEADFVNSEARDGKLVEREVKRRTTDGLRDFLMTVVPVELDEASTRTFGVYTDITERKERQKRVEILNRVLRHDLRNGMNIIKGSAEMLEDVVDGTASVGYVETIVDRAEDLISLAEKTRAVERTLDRDRDATGPVDVRESVQTSIAHLAEEYPAATVTTDLPDSAQVQADDLLRTAIYHVIENALEHNDTGEPTVHVSATNGGGELQLTVADDGPGIPAAERELISEEQEITQLRHASGLGLWLVDWVVTQSGGRLTFADNQPRGSVVTMHVPVAMSEGRTAGRRVE